MSSNVTGFAGHESEAKKRLTSPETSLSSESELISSTKEEVKDEVPSSKKCDKFTALFYKIEALLGPIILLLVASYTRFKLIDRSNSVVWDEAHFGKFGSYYIKHEFYHDVHPPLGKMLIGLTEWLSGFDGEFGFDSGAQYPENVNFKRIRQLNALFSVLCVPVTYFTAKSIGFNLLSVYLISLMVTFESSYIALGKFILLDSMLLFFTTTTFFTMIKVHSLKQQGKELQPVWYKWMILSGLSIGAVCSVKWVGLFITAVFGLYTVQDLYEKLFDKKINWKKYLQHWVIRVITLILIPFIVYLISFKIHFALLYKSGTGDSSTSTLFQAGLEGNNIKKSPRNVIFGSEVTIRSQGVSPNLLHSHHQIYPEGSNQQQITCYGHSDENNNWILKYSRHSNYTLDDRQDSLDYVKDGDIVRLSHKITGVNLHSHEIPAHVSKRNYEVSGYGSEIVGDTKDDWIFEIVDQQKSPNSTYRDEDKLVLHPLSTSFRLKHADLGCYLATTGLSYPAWGFKQSEVVCKYSWSKRDKATWWNVEDHMNSRLEIDEYYTPPKSGFWKDFILINFAMASSNSALVPDYDKFDALASEAWEWPTLHVGLRMCGWGRHNIRYFLIGNLFNTWLSTLSLFVLVGLGGFHVVKYQRQTLNWDVKDFTDFTIKGIYPLIGWALHFLPFVIMGRVTYVHHYVPALFFAMFVFVFLVDKYVGSTRSYIKLPLYGILIGALTYSYFFFAPFYDGMTGDTKDYKYLQLLNTWRVTDH